MTNELAETEEGAAAIAGLGPQTAPAGHGRTEHRGLPFSAWACHFGLRLAFRVGFTNAGCLRLGARRSRLLVFR